MTFDGFLRDDHDALAKVLKEHYDATLENLEVSTRGWNWGVAEVDENDMRFLVRDRLAFSLPLSNIANSSTPRSRSAAAGAPRSCARRAARPS